MVHFSSSCVGEGLACSFPLPLLLPACPLPIALLPPVTITAATSIHAPAYQVGGGHMRGVTGQEEMLDPLSLRMVVVVVAAEKEEAQPGREATGQWQGHPCC